MPGERWVSVPWTRGFDELAEKVDGGWRYFCEAAGPWRVDGCHGSTTRTRRWTTVGKKQDDWLVFYAANDDGSDDTDIVLVLCPSCVKRQETNQ